MAINTSSKAYQSLLAKWYTASQIEQMSGAVASWQSAKDVIANNKIWDTTTSTPTTKSSNQQTITYNWQVSDNKGWTANMNSMSQTAAQANSRDFQVGTWDVAEMPQQPKIQSVATTKDDRLAKAWQGLDYETQQKKLSSIAWLKDALAKKGITSKTAPATTQTTTTPKRTTQAQTPKQDQWDYQDNSQARMNQIADNLNGYRQTMPQLFDDMSAFYNFFIKDKGRSQDQIDFLWDYFNRVQKYGKYDNLSPEQLWTWIANWDIPEDYLNTLKTTDTQKYQEVMTAKQNREDTIKNESFLNDAAAMAWIEWWESEPSSIQYGKWNWIWMDEDSNWIDDRREHYATEEEQWYQKQIADLNAANLDIDNTVKHDYEDLVKKYPWATKATLMAMANDRNANLLREKENNLVELTRLQGYVWYMQEERFEMNKAGADSIAQLQKNLWMYYDYSPEWMAELAQAKYAATNITLDQADSWNETQKQMALQNVLDWYYDKYWDIIQRSEQQVINDVIAYAKKNWVWLAQALQENFVKPLQSKPWFAALNSVSATRPDVFKIWEDTYWYWDENGNLVSIGWNLWGWNLWGWYNTIWWLFWYTDYTPITSQQLNNWIDSFMAEHPLNTTWWQCGSFVNDYLQNLWYDRLYTDPIDKKKAVTNSDTATRWAVAVMDSKNYPQYWHVAIVTDVKWDKVKLLESNWGDDKKVHERWVNKSDILWYFDPSKQNTAWTWWYNEWLTEIYKQWRDKPDSATAVKDFWNTYWDTISAAWVSKDDFLKQYDQWYEMETADAYLDILSHLDQLIELTWWEYDWGERWASVFGAWDVGRAYDYIKNNFTVQWLRDAKQQWLKLWVLSDSDVRMIWNAATTLSWMQSQWTWNKELNAFREKLLNKNKYLRDRYQNKSAYSDNTSISFNSGDKTFTIWETITSNPTKNAKNIRDLWK